MYYGIYKNVRDSAWQCLLDFHIRSLPVDVLQITRQIGIPVIPNRIAQELRHGELGKTYGDGHSWVIIYDDTLSIPQARFVVAHELGHFLLGHNEAFAKYANTTKRSAGNPAEKQADQFAARLLCPSCVLWGLQLQTPEDVAASCLVDPQLAKSRFARLQLLRQRNRFLTCTLEQQVYEQFLPFIQASIAEKRS